MSKDLTHMNECYSCRFKASVPGSAHIECTNPCFPVGNSPDSYGVSHGWFNYPHCFDPVWKPKHRCENFKQAEV